MSGYYLNVAGPNQRPKADLLGGVGAVAHTWRPKADLSPKPICWLIFQAFKTREPFQSLPSPILLLAGGLSVRSVRTLSIPDDFSIFYFLHCLVKNEIEVQKTCFDENQSCSPFNSVQDAPSIKFWGPLFDDFVGMSIFMIWGSWWIQPLC